MLLDQYVNLGALYTLLTIILLYFGFETGRRIENKKCFNPGVESTIPVLEDKFFESEQSSLDDALTTLSGREFACNSQLAFDQLSHLHAKRLKLDDHAKRGDANRDRIATIERKASSARASETAFRSCMSMMMPELLDYWDNNHDSHKSKNWNEGKEKHLGGEGISFQILEQTAGEFV